ncbi:MAG: CoxG family protein [Paracoccaceae bacterium]
MQMQGQRRIDARRDAVWRALNDPEVLKACIPGCDELAKTSDTTFEASVVQKVGPMKARFKGSVALSDVVDAESYTITGEGKGGAAGFAKGGARVTLSDDGAGTLLVYDAEAKVGGKLAQLGSRLVDGFAKKLADEFFTRFQEAVGGPPGEPVVEDAAPAEAEAETGGDAPEEKKKGWFKRLFG